MSETDAAAVAAAEGVPALPRDAVAEILARVPADEAFLFRCAVVCKLWCRLLTDPLILRRLLPAETDRRPSILGFFAARLPLITDQKEKENSTVLLAGAPAFVPAPGCALGPAHLSLASFVRDDAGVLDGAEPLAAHDGLLLLRVLPRPTDHNVLRLAVCNLLTGRLDVLPPLNTFLLDGKGVRGYAVLSSADIGGATTVPHRPAGGYSTFFQVLLIAVHQIDQQLYLHRFSSSAAGAGGASRAWSATPTNFFPHERNWRASPLTNCFRHDRKNTDSFRQRERHFSLGCRSATVCYGTAHWLFECAGFLYIHHVRVDTGRLCTTRILIDVLHWFNARLCLSIDGRLSFVYVREDNLVIWTQTDGDPDYSFGWRLDDVTPVNMDRRCSRAYSLATVCFGEKSGTVFVIYDSDPDSACLVDLRSRLPSKTKVTSWNESFNHMTAVPYEFNWHMFFMSRLGTRL